jgi:L-serine dehydratase
MISVFELFKIGIGPSSSHTVGPMRAAYGFATGLGDQLPHVARVEVTLYGSLAWTGSGHATDKAIILGLAGQVPDTVDPDLADGIVAEATEAGSLPLCGHRRIPFDRGIDIVFDCVTQPPRHPNTMRFRALDAAATVLVEQRWCSVGGGFVVPEDQMDAPPPSTANVPYPFADGAELLVRGEESALSIAEIVWRNEIALRPDVEIRTHVSRVLDTMMLASVERMAGSNQALPHAPMDRVGLFAIAVNEENAAGGRVVTAPTNGAAGVVPAVLRYYRDMVPGSTGEGMERFILTATAIGGLFKRNASISGAEVGCQGEVGVACSMAAAGLAAALGASNAQIENAAEIGMEHHLGMTCDPVGGLVQIPCIERNAFGAIKAITAASLAMHGDGTHRVSLDQVIATMRQTGADMQSKYKETSLGGLAVNFTEC